MSRGGVIVSELLRLICGALVIAAPAIAAAHPLHTSVAQMTVDSRTGEVDISLRVFADDFTAAAEDWRRRNSSSSGVTSRGVAYARASFVVRESTGRAVKLRSCGEKRVGNLMWICLRGRLSPRASIATVMSRVLVEKFKNQVNVVHASYSNRKANLLFTADDGEKRLP
jgi:hypothetical protein